MSMNASQQKCYMYVGVAVAIVVAIWWWKKSNSPENFVPNTLEKLRSQYPTCNVEGCSGVINDRRSKGQYYESRSIPECSGCPRIQYGELLSTYSKV